MSKTELKESDLKQVSGGTGNKASYVDENCNILFSLSASMDVPLGPSIYKENDFINIKDVIDQAYTAYGQSNYQEVKRLLSYLLIFLDSIKPKYSDYLAIINDIIDKVTTVLNNI